jgi:hypothetical protein
MENSNISPFDQTELLSDRVLIKEAIKDQTAFLCFSQLTNKILTKSLKPQKTSNPNPIENLLKIPKTQNFNIFKNLELTTKSQNLQDIISSHHYKLLQNELKQFRFIQKVKKLPSVSKSQTYSKSLIKKVRKKIPLKIF